ncbi:hypothetical protein Y032_0227g2842 [Ancylostoma ceylanicum]|uniref:UBC core domain-containing protein n=3 Tax=Ancylostoma ceylanicum TaxID=53326 RepID=A0A016SHR0_9BILA|nr:hypothetical protein Y032_0227g2842 [Ancylostoma ceylanicum]
MLILVLQVNPIPYMKFLLTTSVKFHLAMRLAQSLATGDDVNNTYEFAVEARAAEPLRILPSQLARHALSSEFARVCRHPIDGMYIVPSACDQFTWFGLLFIRRGIYGGGIFRFNVRIPSDFPATTSLPSVKFDLFIFHPNIDPSSRRPDLTRYFPDGWKKDKHHIQNVLLVVQRLFFSFDFDPESSANPVAATMWREDKEKFRSIAKNCVNQSRMEVYDEPEDANDPNVLRAKRFMKVAVQTPPQSNVGVRPYSKITKFL